jgi:hypothetical protein
MDSQEKVRAIGEVDAKLKSWIKLAFEASAT